MEDEPGGEMGVPQEEKEGAAEEFVLMAPCASHADSEHPQ